MAEGEPGAGSSGAGPLRPDATIEDIQARVAQLSAEAARPVTAPPGDVPGDSAPVAPSPADARVGGSTSTEAASTGPAMAAAKPRRRWLAGLGSAGAIGVGLLLVVGKIGLKLLVVGVAAAALSGAFGGRYDQLPANVRDGYEHRYESAIGTSLDGLSDADRAAHLQDLVTNGASRLDDASLVKWTKLDATALAATDVKTCATIARGWFTKDPDRATLGKAVSKSYESLSIDDFSAIVDLDLKAIEAEKAGSPAVRSISDAVVAPVLDAVDSGLSASDESTLNGMLSGTSVTDDAACSTLRDLNAAAAKLPDAQFQSWSLWLSVP